MSASGVDSLLVMKSSMHPEVSMCDTHNDKAVVHLADVHCRHSTGLNELAHAGLHWAKPALVLFWQLGAICIQACRQVAHNLYYTNSSPTLCHMNLTVISY